MRAALSTGRMLDWMGDQMHDPGRTDNAVIRSQDPPPYRL
jgi:hypothetical protein